MHQIKGLPEGDVVRFYLGSFWRLQAANDVSQASRRLAPIRIEKRKLAKLSRAPARRAEDGGVSAVLYRCRRLSAGRRLRVESLAGDSAACWAEQRDIGAGQGLGQRQ